MALRYVHNRESGRCSWALEESEEKLLIAAFTEIRGRVDPRETWPTDFWEGFIERGVNIAETMLARFNEQRKRLSLEPLVFRETEASDVTKERFELLPRRIQRRDIFFRQFLELDQAGRTQWYEQAKAEAAQLPDPLPGHFLSERLAAQKAKEEALPILSRREAAGRVAAMEEATRLTAAQKRRQHLDGIVRRLRVAGPEMRGRIIDTLEPDDALELAERDELADQDTRDALVARSMPWLASAGG